MDIHKKSLIIPPIIIITLIKILLIPSYKSTDFDVHRNWLAITKHLPLSEWYFNDINGTTVHTLDYPPSFAFFEFLLSNNAITSTLVKHNILNERCLGLVGDDENSIIGDECIVFQRSTVIVFDFILFIGAYMMSQTFIYDNTRQKQSKTYRKLQYSKSMVCFLLIVTNSGLLVLDHVHFQYNGMLIGILLSSIAMLLQSIKSSQHIMSTSADPQKKEQQYYQRIANDIYMKKFDLFGAILFAFLLTFKHMYLTLSPFYFFYLLRRFCFMNVPTNNHHGANKSCRFSIPHLIVLGLIVLMTLIGPFLPFIQYGFNDQMTQIIKRLFPWQRGLCHDYWAGNIWALYLGFEKIMNYVARFCRVIKYRNSSNEKTTFDSIIMLVDNILPFPIISPSTAALFLFIGLVPSMYCAWKIGSSTTVTSNSNNHHHQIQPSEHDMMIMRQKGILYCIIYSALSSFMLSYHVHEKAIMTGIITLNVLAVTSRESARLFLRLSFVGHFGLLPLLYKPTELSCKVLLTLVHFLLSWYLLEMVTASDFGDDIVNDESSANQKDNTKNNASLLTKWDRVGMMMTTAILFYSEVYYPFVLKPKGAYEFLPLMITSLWCALVFLICWVHSGILMFRYCVFVK